MLVIQIIIINQLLAPNIYIYIYFSQNGIRKIAKINLFQKHLSRIVSTREINTFLIILTLLNTGKERERWQTFSSEAMFKYRRC